MQICKYKTLIRSCLTMTLRCFISCREGMKAKAIMMIEMYGIIVLLDISVGFLVNLAF